MNNDDKFTSWVNNLKASGKTDEEIGQLMAGIVKSSGLDIYNAIMLSLTEEDLQEVEKIENEVGGKAKIEELFKLRTGMTIDEFTAAIQTAYLSQQVSTKNTV